MGTFFANLMPYILLIQSISFLVFMTAIESQFNSEGKSLFEAYKKKALDNDWIKDNFDEATKNIDAAKSKLNATASDLIAQYKSIDGEGSLLSPEIVAWPICALTCAVLCICMPMRSIIQHMTQKELSEEERDNTAYKERAAQFADCYDTANPLTSKQGKNRLLDIQIENLEKQGEDGAAQAQMLREQKQFVNSMDNRAAMQNYVQRSHVQRMQYIAAHNPAQAYMMRQRQMHQQAFMRQQMIRQQQMMYQQQMLMRQQHMYQAMGNQQYQMNRMGAPMVARPVMGQVVPAQAMAPNQAMLRQQQMQQQMMQNRLAQQQAMQRQQMANMQMRAQPQVMGNPQVAPTQMQRQQMMQ